MPCRPPEGIKKDRVVGLGDLQGELNIQTSPVIISITDLLQNVNKRDSTLLKYVPQEVFLTTENARQNTINGKTGIVGAVVRKTSGNRYYTHRIIMPDGYSFIFEPKKVEPTSSDVLTTQRDKQGTDIGSTNNSISKKSANVNP